MFNFLRPMELKVDVGDRSYNLGDTLEVTVVLRARGNAVVREARIALVYEETFTEVFTAMVPERGMQKAEHGVSPVGTYQPLPPPLIVEKWDQRGVCPHVSAPGRSGGRQRIGGLYVTLGSNPDVVKSALSAGQIGEKAGNRVLKIIDRREGRGEGMEDV